MKFYVLETRSRFSSTTLIQVKKKRGHFSCGKQRRVGVYICSCYDSSRRSARSTLMTSTVCMYVCMYGHHI